MNIQRTYTMIIFDWDGTLMDSAHKIVDSLSYAAQQIGMPVRTDEEYRYIIGLDMHAGLQHLYPNETYDAQQLATHYRERFYSPQAHPSPLFEGVPDLLDTLEQRGYLLAVATGKSRSGLNEILNSYNWHNRFHITRTADETASKPNPLMLSEIAQEMGVTPQDCLMVGDTTFDVDMAHAIGMDSIGLSCGAHSREAITACHPRAILGHPTELLDYLPSCTSTCAHTSTEKVAE